MRERKLTMNGLIIILIVFSAIGLFATVFAFRVMDPSVMNDFYPIEDTGYGIRYSTFEPSGIVKGSGNTASELILEGTYGTDWGAAAQGDTLYVNKYRMSSMGLILCDVAKIDLSVPEETILFRDTILRGRCASGELVLQSGTLLPANNPSVNALCSLYTMSSRTLRTDDTKAAVLFYDPSSQQVVWQTTCCGVGSDDFEERFLDKTLKEVQACE